MCVGETTETVMPCGGEREGGGGASPGGVAGKRSPQAGGPRGTHRALGGACCASCGSAGAGGRV